MSVLSIFNPVANIKSIRQVWSLIAQNHGLIKAITIRDLRDRYAGQVLGAVWALLTPLLLMAVYVFVFTFIFKGRLGDGDAGGLAFTGYMVAGLTPWLAFAEATSRSVVAVSGNANLVKQIVFPTEILPLKTALATLPTLFVGLAVSITILAIAGQTTLFGLGVLLPFAILCYLVFVSGLCYLLAAIGVFFKDLKDVITFLLSIGLFLHPILYPPQAAPAALSEAFNYSPISYMIWSYALTGPTSSHPWLWLIFPLSSIVMFLIGWRVFAFLKPTFGNVL